MKATILLLISIISPAANAEVIAFIGAPLSVERSDKSCMEYIEQPDAESGLEAVCMDRAFLLEYEVIKVISGSPQNGSINFVGFYHSWGMPNYTTYEPALIVVSTEKNQLHLRHIEYAEKRDGVWWVCQEWSELKNEECKKEARAQDVAMEVIQKI